MNAKTKEVQSKFKVPPKNLLKKQLDKIEFVTSKNYFNKP